MNLWTDSLTIMVMPWLKNPLRTSPPSPSYNAPTPSRRAIFKRMEKTLVGILDGDIRLAPFKFSDSRFSSNDSPVSVEDACARAFAREKG